MTSDSSWAGHRRRTPEQMEEVIASMSSQVTRLVELSNALLELEEARAVDSLRREDVAVDELLEDAVAAALPRGTPVEIDAPGTTAYVDRRWMTIAISNLLRNAHRHGEGEILVQATQSVCQLQIVVRDSGPGFPEDFRQHAFDRFSRAEDLYDRGLRAGPLPGAGCCRGPSGQCRGSRRPPQEHVKA